MTSILWPFLAQIGWTMLLYAWLTLARKQAVDSGAVDYSAFLLGRDEPLVPARIARNLANQFELPVIFYALVILLLVLGHVTALDVIAAWVFVGGRVAHSLVQTLTNNVPLRGQIFMINFLAVVVLAGHVAWLAFQGAPEARARARGEPIAGVGHVESYRRGDRGSQGIL